MRIFRRIATALLGAAVLGVWLWGVLALACHPWTPLWLGVLLAAGFTASTLAIFWRAEERSRGLCWFAALAVGVLLFSMLPQPTNDRDWADTQAVMPASKFNGNQVTIHNLRRSVEHSDGGLHIEHYDQTFDLGELESVWYGVQHFSQLKSLAHTFVSFGFSSGDYLAISIESRRRQDEGFSPLAGMFRNYGMIYVAGDEMEIIGWRSANSDDPIYLYPIRASRPQVQAMLVDMLGRANALAEQPEFYNTWTNNCTNNIVLHFNKVAPKPLWPYSPSIAFPGYTGRVAYQHGLIDSDDSFEAIQQRAHINDPAREVKSAEEFSAAIRKNYRQEAPEPR